MDPLACRMKKTITIIFVAIYSCVFAQPQQQKVKGQVSTVDTADLSILNIYPATFPDVSVVFRAETRKGVPVWNLTKEKMNVTENGKSCEVISLDHLSANRPIVLGVVIDHSGSMAGIGDHAVTTISHDGRVDTIQSPVMSTSSPIDNAKRAVKNFVKSFNSQKDLIGIIGFSSYVDTRISPTRDISAINIAIDSMHATASTALYDAMIVGIDEVRSSEGVKVLIALTDGFDNASKAKWNEVVDRANKDNVPVYIIGLGEVNRDTLQLIASKAKGKCYFTDSPSSLDSIYAEISKQIRAFYDLTYRSTNFSSADTSRSVELRFDIDSIYLVTGPSAAVIPGEVLAAVSSKNKSMNYYLWGGIAIVAALVVGVLIYKFFKNTADKKSDRIPVITKVYPNPSTGPITIEVEGSASQLKVFNLNGGQLGAFAISGGEIHFDLSKAPRGNYIVIAYYGASQSNAVQFVLQ